VVAVMGDGFGGCTAGQRGGQGGRRRDRITDRRDNAMWRGARGKAIELRSGKEMLVVDEKERKRK
jgi:hypothetical protein